MKLRKKANKGKKSRVEIIAVVSFAIIALYCLSMYFVLSWAFINSIKDVKDLQGFVNVGPNYFGFPREEFKIGELVIGGYRFDNYLKAFTQLKVTIDGGVDILAFQMLINSLIISIGSSIVSIISHAIVAYACARYKFRLSKLIYGTAIVVMIIPIVGSLPSSMQIMHNLRLKDTIIGYFFMKGGYTGLYFLIFYAAFKNIPYTYTEAAKIDGAGNFKIMLQIIMPMARATISATLVLLFINNWNDYITPMLYLPQMPTISYGLFKMLHTPENAVDITLHLAGCFIACVPCIILFVLFRKQIMGNVTMGGLKG